MIYYTSTPVLMPGDFCYLAAHEVQLRIVLFDVRDMAAKCIEAADYISRIVATLPFFQDILGH